MTMQDRWPGLTIKVLRDLRSSGDPIACILLASLIGTGAVKAVGPSELREALACVAEKHPLGSYLYARDLLRSDGAEVRGMQSQAMHLLEGASSAGLSIASTLLGLLNETGLCCKSDAGLARKYYELGAAQGDPEAWGLLGSLLVSDRGEISEPEKALIYFENAVSGGHWPSAPLLATLYFRSQLPVKTQEALRLLQAGADHDDFGCLMRLASIYRHGEYGVQRDAKLAGSLEKRAHEAAAKSRPFIQ